MSSRFHGRALDTTKKAGRRNKGVARAVRDLKREEAEARQANTDPRNTKAFQRGSSYDPNTGKRRPWKAHDYRLHGDRVLAFITKQDQEVTA